MTAAIENRPAAPAEEAFRQLIVQYIHLVYAACRRQLRDAHLAEDATQAVFILLYQRGHRLPADRLASWLLTASRFTCANIRKMERRRTRRELERGAAMPSIQPAGASDDHDQDILRHLDDALDRLSAADREAVALHYFQNQPYASVGVTLGLSEDAARKRVTRALDKLRSSLMRHGIPASSAALATLLPSQTNAAALPPSVVASLSNSIIHTCRAGASTPAVAIAQGARLMMLTHTMKTAGAASLIALAVFAAGWWGVTRFVYAADALAPVAAPTIALDLSSPEKALASYCAALKAGDRTAAQACCSDPAHAPTASDALLSLMLAQNRLILADAHAFKTDGQEARLFTTIDQVLEQVITYDRARHQTADINGDSAILQFRLSDPQIAAFPEAVQPQIRSFVDHPMHFVREGGQWKLRRAPEHALQVTISLLDKNNQPVSDPQTQIQVVNDYAGVFDQLASEINSNAFSNWADAAAALRVARSDFHKQNGLSDIEIKLSPPPATKP